MTCIAELKTFLLKKIWLRTLGVIFKEPWDQNDLFLRPTSLASWLWVSMGAARLWLVSWLWVSMGAARLCCGNRCGCCYNSVLWHTLLVQWSWVSMGAARKQVWIPLVTLNMLNSCSWALYFWVINEHTMLSVQPVAGSLHGEGSKLWLSLPVWQTYWLCLAEHW